MFAFLPNNIPIGDSYVKGNKNAPITMIKFTDFQWPYCARAVSIVDELLKKYPDDLKVVIKSFPLGFHKQAKKAAQYWIAADMQGKGDEMYHQIFKNFRQLRTNEDLPVDYAKQMRLNMKQFKKDANSPTVIAKIDREMKEFKSAGFPRQSVPKFVIQGKEPAGGRSVEDYSEIIDAELEKLK